MPAQDDENLSEPFLIALIIALGGPAVTKSIRDILKRRYENQEETLRINTELRKSEMGHKYKMAELQLRVKSADGSEREISEKLEGLA